MEMVFKQYGTLQVSFRRVRGLNFRFIERNSAEKGGELSQKRLETLSFRIKL